MAEPADDFETDLWVGVSRAMRGAVLDHRGSLPTKELRDYWQVPDANHGHMLAEAAIAHLRALPVDQRMEAMGMVEYGNVTWDDEEERDIVEDPIDVTPGAPVYVERMWVT